LKHSALRYLIILIGLSQFSLIAWSDECWAAQRVIQTYTNEHQNLTTAELLRGIDPLYLSTPQAACEAGLPYLNADYARTNPQQFRPISVQYDPRYLLACRYTLAVLLPYSVYDYPNGYPNIEYDEGLYYENRAWAIPRCATSQSQTLTLTPVPQTPPDPRPKGAEGKGGKSTLDLIAKVMEGVNPKAGVAVTFAVEVAANSGGHDHHDAKRPKGTVTPTEGVTDANGEIKIRFNADEPSGTHVVAAACITCTNTSVTNNIDVKVPDLIYIPPDYAYTPTRYVLVGNFGDASNGYKHFNHKDTHFITEKSLENFKSIIQTFADLGWGQMGINDASLYWGGLFDIEGKWAKKGGHAEHRDGQQVDISFVRPASVSNDLRKKVFDEVCGSKGAALPVILWHQNDGYAPHFHIYLTGQGSSGNKKQCGNS
jgi:hypothetical protein